MERNEQEYEKHEKNKGGVASKPYFFQRASAFLFSNPAYTRSCYSTAPQAVLKIAGYGRNAGVMRMLKYIARVEDKQGREQTELEDSYGNRLYGEDAVKELYNDWAETFDRRADLKSRHGTHLILSAAAENNRFNLNKTLAAARNTARKHFGKRGYAYVLGLHQDSSKPHVHIIVKNTHDLDGKKLTLNPPDLQDIRETFAKELTECGLEHTAARKIHKISYLKSIRKTDKYSRIKERLRSDIAVAAERIEYQNRPAKDKRQALKALEAYTQALNKELKDKAYKKDLKLLNKKIWDVKRDLKTISKPSLRKTEKLPGKTAADIAKQPAYTAPLNAKEGIKRIKTAIKQLKKGNTDHLHAIERDLTYIKETSHDKKTLRSVNRYEKIFYEMKTAHTDKELLPPNRKTLNKLKKKFKNTELERIKTQKDAEKLLNMQENKHKKTIRTKKPKEISKDLELER